MSHVITHSLFTAEHQTGRHVLKAIGCLTQVGSQEPYFSLTGEEWTNDVMVGGGMMHDTLLRTWPELQPLADLHLSSPEGVPMHCLANGYYWLAGAVGGLGERYHGASDHDPEQCLEYMSKHFRVSLDDARTLALEIKDTYNSAKDHATRTGSTKAETHHLARQAAQARLSSWVDQQRPRWKAEATECIALLSRENKKVKIKDLSDGQFFWAGGGVYRRCVALDRDAPRDGLLGAQHRDSEENPKWCAHWYAPDKRVVPKP